jgi:hypothetical protein
MDEVSYRPVSVSMLNVATCMLLNLLSVARVRLILHRSVGIVMGYRLDSRDSIPYGATFFSAPQRED